jgi:transcriptional antiterminator RfaH
MKSWYLLCCQGNTWRRTLVALEGAKIDVCCPLIHETRVRTDKKTAVRHVALPLFPGYIFTRFNPHEIHTTTILRMPGVKGFVRCGKEISTVNEDVISAIYCSPFNLLDVNKDYFRCVNVDPTLLSEMNEIYESKDHTSRVTSLMSLISKQEKTLKRTA